jgi:hypothetical protein
VLPAKANPAAGDRGALKETVSLWDDADNSHPTPTSKAPPARRRGGHRTARLSGRVTSATGPLGAWRSLGDISAAMLRRWPPLRKSERRAP